MNDPKWITDIYSITDDQLDEQIKLRADILPSLIGQLYPSIIVDELYYLKNRKFLSSAKAEPIVLKPNDPGNTFNAGPSTLPPPLRWYEGFDNE